jgi:hypothetical protein
MAVITFIIRNPGTQEKFVNSKSLSPIRNPGTQEKFKIFIPNSWLFGFLLRDPGTWENS